MIQKIPSISRISAMLLLEKGKAVTAESAYNAWAKPHHEGADWSAFNAGYKAGLREAARECQSYIIERGDSVVACGGIRCRDRIMALLSDPK